MKSSAALSSASFALLHDNRRFGRLALLLVAASVAAAFAHWETFVRVNHLAFLGLGLGLARGSVGRDRIAGRSVLYFQRPVSPLAHYTRKLALGTAFMLAATLLVMLALAIQQAFGGASGLWVYALASFYWGAVILVAGTAMSSLTRRHDLELMLLLYAATLVQVLIVQALDMPALRDPLRWLLLPLDAVFATTRSWAGGEFTVQPRHLLQLIGYPLAWLAVLAWRLRREDLGAAEHQVA